LLSGEKRFILNGEHDIIGNFKMSFITKLFNEEPSKITRKDIESFIHQEPSIEESSHLDYKALLSEIDYDELAKDVSARARKDVSAFANTDGGLLILGVSEERETNPKTKRVRIYPKAITWGKLSIERERLEQLLMNKIQSNIPDLTIQPVRRTSKDPSVIFLIDIPKSPNAPHMALPVYRYYVRLNFRNNPMEHYQIQNLFSINWLLAS
jgi:predicted HTH transcriptional regulator